MTPRVIQPSEVTVGMEIEASRTISGGLGQIYRGIVTQVDNRRDKFKIGDGDPGFWLTHKDCHETQGIYQFILTVLTEQSPLVHLASQAYEHVLHLAYGFNGATYHGHEICDKAISEALETLRNRAIAAEVSR